MQYRMLAPVVLFCAMLISFETNAVEEPGLAFIKSEFFGENITLEQFQTNPDRYIRSEKGLDLLTDFIGGEIGITDLTNAQFIALIRDNSQVRTRDCPTSEEITTGAIKGDGLEMNQRFCRSGEQIVQFKLGDRWIDGFSLNCLNPVRDQTPIPAPVIVLVVPPVSPKAEPVGGEVPGYLHIGCKWINEKVTYQGGLNAWVQPVFAGYVFAPGVAGSIQEQTFTTSELNCDKVKLVKGKVQ